MTQPQPQPQSPAQPHSYRFHLDPAGRPAFAKAPERVAAEIGWLNANRASPRGGDPVQAIGGMVIHATAGATAAGAIGWWRAGAGAQASAHWVVPGPRDPGHGDHVIACVYEALAAWHVRGEARHAEIAGGRRGMNRWTLGVEVVNRQDGVAGFTDWQVAATAALARYAWAKYPNFRWVFSHAAVDPGRRSDPGVTFPWAKFEAMVRGGSGLRTGGVAAVVGTVEAARPCCG